jgi:hypothetical protein
MFVALRASQVNKIARAGWSFVQATAHHGPPLLARRPDCLDQVVIVVSRRTRLGDECSGLPWR